MADIKKIKGRWQQLEGRKLVFENVQQDITDYVLPRKSDIQKQRVEGARRTEKVFDSTAIHANEVLAASMHGSLTSPSIKWFSLKMRQDELNDDQSVKLWLSFVENLIFLALRLSNFNSEIFETYLDLGSVATGCLFEEEKIGDIDFNGINFRNIETSEYIIGEGQNGQVDSVYRKFQLSARNIVERFGQESVTENTLKKAKEKPEELITIAHAVFPRTLSEQRIQPAPLNFPHASVFFEWEKSHELEEGGFMEFPYMVPRWAKSSGEMYGRGPAWTALPDIKVLNRQVQLKLRGLAKAIDPPMKMVEDGVIGKIFKTASGVTVVRSQDSLLDFGEQIRFDVNAIEEEKLRDAIKRIYFADQLQLPQNGPQMTAFETQVRFDLMQRLLGPTFGRLVTELLNPLIDRTFGLLQRNGMLPEPPQILQAIGGDIDVEYEGPLARAQRSGDITAMQRWLEVNAPFLQAQPQLLDVIDLDQWSRHSANIVGIPPIIMRSVEDVLAKREEAQQALQQQQQLEGMNSLADTVGKAGPGIKGLAESGVIDALSGAVDQAQQQTV